MSDTPRVKNCPIYEAMSKKLLGYDSVPAIEKSKMLVRAIKAAKELAAPRVIELERENTELKQSCDDWQKKAESVENLLMTIQAWDIDKHELRGHQCLAKQWICSFQDRINRYKRGKK